MNYEYVKNVLIQYFMTTDVTVHANLMRVVFVAMRFSEDEQSKVSEAFNTNNQTFVGKMLNGFF